jgi:hypothetical protein
MDEINKDAKLQNDKEWMTDAWINKKLSAGEISNLLHISVKLVHIKLREFDLA